MKNKYLLNTLLAVLVFAALAIMMLVRIFVPAAILPPINIPNIVLVSLAALLLDDLLIPNAPRCYICVAAFGTITFGVLTPAAGFADLGDFWVYGLTGGAVFTLTTWLFTSMAERLRSGACARPALFMGAVGIFLASQCFMGIIL